MPGRPLMAGGLLLVTAMHARAAGPSCLQPGAACSLREAAEQAGIYVGAAVDSSLPPDQVSDVETHCTAVTSENAFKWGEMEPVRGAIDFTHTDAFVAWTRAQQLRLRAHTLFWHRLQVPPWVRPLIEGAVDPATTLRTVMRERVEAVVGRYRGQIPVWDVVNEPLATFGAGYDLTDGPLSPKNFFYTTLGTDYIAEAFTLAHRADPRAKLFLNEIVWDPRLGDAKADAFLALVTDLRRRRVPIHGIGIQTHGFLGVQSPLFPSTTADFRAYLDAFRRLHVKVEITELDVRLPLLASASDPLAAQADVYARAVEACAGARHCTGVTVWGLRDRDSWLDSYALTSATAPNRPLLLDDAGMEKPAYFAVRDALLGRCRPWTRRTPCARPWPRRLPAP